MVIAIYLIGSPAAQSLYFVNASMLTIVVQLGRRPFDSASSNVLEIFNELIVLTIGYQVLILTCIEVDVTQRINIGT